jgi:glycosyltransferase involved in cell wall biosynthesis
LDGRDGDADVSCDRVPPLHIALVTVGDPERLSGGYLYHLRIAELAPRHGAKIDFVCFPDRPFPLARLAARRIGRRVRALHPDAVLLDSIAAAFYAPGAASTRDRPAPPLLAVLHQPPGGIGHPPWRAALQARMDRTVYAQAERLLVASAALGAELAAAGFAQERLVVAEPGCDVAERPHAPPADLRRGRAAALLFVGNWLAAKGLLDLLDAVATLPEGTATLHLVGDDAADSSYAARVRARLARPELAARVVNHGKLSRGGVAAMYAAADVFVLPATKETYGTVYGEAMAAGLPVVGWRAGNLPHLARHEVEGLVLEPGELQALAAALARLAADEPLRRRLGAAARRRAQSFPTWDETAARVVSAVAEVVARARAAAP